MWYNLILSLKTYPLIFLGLFMAVNWWWSHSYYTVKGINADYEARLLKANMLVSFPPNKLLQMIFTSQINEIIKFLIRLLKSCIIR